jgi:hypothetical protein
VDLLAVPEGFFREVRLEREIPFSGKQRKQEVPGDFYPEVRSGHLAENLQLPEKSSLPVAVFKMDPRYTASGMSIPRHALTGAQRMR